MLSSKESYENIHEADTVLSVMSSTKQINVAVKILMNIIKYPQQTKYHKINLKRLRSHIQCKNLLKLLLLSGFEEFNHISLILNKNNTKHMEYIYFRCKQKQDLLYQQLRSSSTQPTQIKKTNEQTQETHIQNDCVIQQSTNHTVNECKHLQRLQNCLKDNIKNISLILNDFHHLLSEHDSSKEFEYIYNVFGKCDIKNCASVKRVTYSNYSGMTGVTQIIDKIHCYYAHSIDIGYRTSENNKKETTSTDVQNTLLFAAAEKQCSVIVKLHTKLMHKYQQLLSIDDSRVEFKLNDPTDMHFTDDTAVMNMLKGPITLNGQQINTTLETDNHMIYLSRSLSQQKYLANKIQNLHKYSTALTTKNKFINFKDNNSNSPQLYQIGYKFNYDEKISGGGIIIYKKYDTMKQEMIQNTGTLIRMTMEQFKLEVSKAKLHLTSHYRKKHYLNMKIEHLLSMMIYCNFDKIQSEFSKTYRQNLNRHQYFYHLGKNLTDTVQLFGQKVCDSKATSFYHGIADKLSFASIIGEKGLGIPIYCPVSTSTSFEVAANFANSDNGMIFEFGGKYCECKYFSASWCSDYCNEKECLFIQNPYVMEIANIIDIGGKCQYNEILLSLKTIERAFTIYIGGRHCFGDLCEEDYDITLIRKIIYHQLSQKLPTQFSSFKSLNSYAKTMIDTYFNNVKAVKIIFIAWELRRVYKAHNALIVMLQSIFFLSDCKWVKISLLNILFPNVETISIDAIPLCQEVMDDIVCHMMDTSGMSKLRHIKILPTTKDIPKWVNDYSETFKQLGWVIKPELSGCILSIKAT
eukprot:15698_1